MPNFALPSVVNTSIPIMSVNSDMLKKSPPVYLFNVGPEQHEVTRGGLGTFIVPPCPKGERVSKALVISGIYPEQLNAGEQIITNYQTGEDIANDILGIHSTLPTKHEFTTNLQWKGVFVSHNERPIDEEIVAAKSKRAELLDWFIEDGDRRSLVGPGENGMAGIGINHRNAVQERKQKRGWASVAVPQDECPACGSAIKAGIAVCPHCSAVIDEDKARRFFPGRFAQTGTEAKPESEVKQQQERKPYKA
jgi:hypothetical protein